MYKIVLLRHGESVWNKENRFTGWTDVDLSEAGIDEAKKAGETLKKSGFVFDIAYTSYLKRAIRTSWIVLDILDRMWIPSVNAWQLNERHYGALQGLNKAEMAKKYGEEQVFIWRRSFDVRPPALSVNNPSHPAKDKKYAQVDAKKLPSVESLKDACKRVVPYWKSDIAGTVKEGKAILITAHGNSLRALVKHLDVVGDDQITSLNIPTGAPLVYELDGDLKPIKHYYLGDQDEIQRQMEKVKNQGKA
ncbi:MAG: 2,3-diphosphoglycerate-dependent phosphoglycerate mutase [Candidatus Nealsonbacteria bacterium]|nr:2,3-diphosphoglycerate-dependent phosphoglycerate mutase [Candidatus Nealsonbacteria bacterium]